MRVVSWVDLSAVLIFMLTCLLSQPYVDADVPMSRRIGGGDDLDEMTASPPPMQRPFEDVAPPEDARDTDPDFFDFDQSHMLALMHRVATTDVVMGYAMVDAAFELANALPFGVHVQTMEQHEKHRNDTLLVLRHVFDDDGCHFSMDLLRLLLRDHFLLCTTVRERRRIVQYAIQFMRRRNVPFVHVGQLKLVVNE